MDNALHTSVNVTFTVRGDAAVAFLSYIDGFHFPEPAVVSTSVAPVGDIEAAPDSAVNPTGGPTDEQVEIFWNGLLEMGEDHGLIKIVRFWLAHPGQRFHRGQIADALDLHAAQVSNWMRSLRHYLRRAGLPYFYGNDEGLGIDEPYASALLEGLPSHFREEA